VRTAAGAATVPATIPVSAAIAAAVPATAAISATAAVATAISAAAFGLSVGRFKLERGQIIRQRLQADGETQDESRHGECNATLHERFLSTDAPELARNCHAGIHA
jgi:hypothetical protein